MNNSINSISFWKKYPQLKTYLILVIGFTVCNYLTTTWLPAVGLKWFADLYSQFIDGIAPYLLLPVCLYLAVQTWKHNKYASLIVTLTSLGMDYYFFVNYKEIYAWISLAAIGVGVAISIFLSQKSADTDAQLKKYNLVSLIIAYVVGIAFTFLLKSFLAKSQIGGSFHNDVMNALPIIPTLCTALIVYVSRFNQKKV